MLLTALRFTINTLVGSISSSQMQYADVINDQRLEYKVDDHLRKKTEKMLGWTSYIILLQKLFQI